MRWVTKADMVTFLVISAWVAWLSMVAFILWLVKLILIGPIGLS